MKQQNKLLLIGISTLISIATIMILADANRKRKMQNQRQEIADEGYETAYDILYPLKTKQFRGFKGKLT